MKRFPTYIVLLTIIIGCGQNQRKNANLVSESQQGIFIEGYDEIRKDLYLRETDYRDGAWNDSVQVFHYWRELDDASYLFDVPTERQINAWEMLCEERNPVDGWIGVPHNFSNMNQAVTVSDFIELMFSENSLASNLDLGLWRLAQYVGNEYLEPDSEYDRFYYLKSIYQGLCLYEPDSQVEYNQRAGLESCFQTFYNAVMLREALRQASPQIARALEKEETAWKKYHTAANYAYERLQGNSDGWNGSAWPMATCGMSKDDSYMREISLTDFLFALTDSLDYEVRHPRSLIDSYEPVTHRTVSQDKVLREYRHFMATLEEDEYSYPLRERKEFLMKEMEAWKVWMNRRADVSHLLTGFCKETYDNTTNNVRRYKLIMLKNQYEGFGVTSGDVMDCLISYDIPDDQLDGPSFDDRWRQLLNDIDNE